MQDVRGIGKKYEIKEVSDGHARNFLMPRKLAEAATPSALSRLDALKREMEKEDAELTKRLVEIKNIIQSNSIKFPVKADENGNVFGSINKESILKAMREHGWVTKERVEVILDHPLKKVGEYKIKINLKKGIEAELNTILEVEK